jgi:hypothetical protein
MHGTGMEKSRIFFFAKNITNKNQVQEHIAKKWKNL